MKFKNLESFNPKECISGKIMRINRVTANIFRKHLSPFNITDSQLTLLFILTKKDTINQKQLSDITRLEKSSLNRSVKRLIELKLISKVNFPQLNITTKGKRLVNDIIPEWKKAMAKIEELLEDDGKEALNTITNKLIK